ncbi:hypothetical protein EIN_359770 [Entamoeba invadens IP1]|uniref:Protein kinase domain-containing protein n=1 Tax=Entamoeba invadens IP1 TaxID=370355 RepID=A0A0A1UDQ6_ENTIV|nr:hypothetical protein EIN_359770 [Entamoeba invadens IP1]ELP90884.1 hypothetical protein EIN_359770 [Entamoeba invadens IP1]|eukprot:XP_004257655.1 hypothetical protein EIN_359770 [Entamoeba invadens IP1]
MEVENEKRDRFVLREVLYTSKTGTVLNKAITMVRDGKYSFFVVKRIPIPKDDPTVLEGIRREVEVSKIVDHSYIVRCYDGFLCEYENKLEYWMVLEYCPQKSVDFYTHQRKCLTEGEKYFFLCDLSICMEYLIQSLHVQHLSLNPHNLILTKDTSSPIPKLKVANCFEHVRYETPKDKFMHNPFYAAPEMYLGRIEENSDIWSIGILIYVLFSNKFPMPPNKVFEFLSTQQKFDLEPLNSYASLKDLLKRMLVYDPAQRLKWSEFFIHPFIQRCRDYKIDEIHTDASNYTPKKIIGKGAYGVVFLASHTQDGVTELVAMKETGESKSDFLLKEARVMRLCVHPNVVAFHEYISSPEKLSQACVEPTDIVVRESILESHYYYMVMEYCELGNLEKYLEKNGGPLSTNEILHFLAEIASGLWYLHFCKHIIHRDLKLENFLLCKPEGREKYPRLKIADYGLSRAFGDDSQLMQTNVGTFIYVSPEIKNHKVYTTKSDLYSLGVALYRLATFEYPFSANKATIDYAFQTKQPISFPSYVNVEFHLQDLIKKLITHDEESRLSWREFFAHQFVYRAMQHHAAQGYGMPTAHDFDLLEEQQIVDID